MKNFRTLSLLPTLLCAGLVAIPLAISPVIAAPSNDYKLGAEDVLEVSVTGHPDLSLTLTVQPDGKISMPEAGELVARGKTIAQLTREIDVRLARSLNNAKSRLMIKQARPQQARIIGAVKSVGTYSIKSGARLMDLVAQAGGLNTKPIRVSGRMVRGGQDIKLDIPGAVKSPNGPANIALRPDDLVMLDAVDYAGQITVMGEVARPGAYDLDEDLTVMSLLAQAGGPSEGAALRNASVLRAGKPVLTDLSAIKAGALPSDSALARFKFQPGDVLTIPENTARFGVQGQVNKPAYFALSEDAGQATVLRALAEAGGATPDGDLAGATISRSVDGETIVVAVNLTEILSGQKPDNIVLQDRDVLIVPKRQELKASVIGQVSRPGAYPIDGDTTLLTLLAQAGNPLKGAGLSRSYVLRDGAQMPLDLRDAIIANRPSAAIANFRLQPDDVLVIRDVSDQIKVMGQVAKPGAYSLDDGLTMMSLLSNAGGATETAALSQSYVLRSNTKIPVDLRGTIAGGQTLAFRFEPGDVLFVPDNPQRFGVLGQVAKPGYFPYPEDPKDASILKVLTQAGGPSSAGYGPNLKEAGIIRTVNGEPKVIPVKLTDALKTGENSDLQLQPGDVLYIPPKKKGFSWGDVLLPLAALSRLGLGF